MTKFRRSVCTLLSATTIASGAAIPLATTASAQASSLSSAYPTAVLADHPTSYFRFDETTGNVAHDSSGNGNDGSYVASDHLGAAGAINGDPDTAFSSADRTIMFTQSGDTLPVGSSARTFETWVNYACCSAAIALLQYGDVAGGNGFAVMIGDNATTIGVVAGAASVSAASVGDFAHGWHLVDVTYDGSNVTIYQDGQIVGDGTLGPIATVAPGQGLRVTANAAGMGIDELAAYPAALSPTSIEAHWSASGNAAGRSGCSPAPATPYTNTVLADHPLGFYRLDELATDPGSRIAFDSSPHCANAAFVNHPSSAVGALRPDTDSAIAASNRADVFSQSGDTMPAAATSRTFETWIDYACCSAAVTLFQYGDMTGGNGFSVTVGDNASNIVVNAGAASVSVPAVGDFAHGWHLLDVTYDATSGMAAVYQDGQIIGGGPLDFGAVGTVVPGQGLRMTANAGGMGLDDVAFFGTALTPAAIDVHWSAGEARDASAPCAAAPTAPYATSVLADLPAMYYRFDDTTAGAPVGVALDSSSHCRNGAYEDAPSPANGALSGDSDAALSAASRNLVFAQSGDALPAGNTPRSFEMWIDYACCTAGLTLLQYGDVTGGNGFAITLGDNGNSIGVSAGTASASAATVGDFAHGWHLVDVTYDGSTAEIYQDGQIIGGGPLGTLATVVPGQGLRLTANAGGMGVDELAAYPVALATKRVNAHYAAQYLTPPGYSLLAGTATLAGGGGAQGARVQACPTSGTACIVDAYPTGADGQFHLLVPDDTYTVTVYPPSGSPSGPKVLGPFTLPPSQQSLAVQFPVPGGLPTGSSFQSPSGGSTSAGAVPTVNWGEPSSFTVTGCKNGAGILYVHATNTSTGQPEVHAIDLVEQPAGSGTYVAQIPPLAPDHGLGALDPLVTCPGETHVLPDGGSPAGGQHVILASNGGFAGAKSVAFGAVNAPSFTVVNDNLIDAVVPAGTDTVTVSVTNASSAVVNIGTYHYFDVTSISPTSGPTSGATTVTITGHGFDGNVRGVLFGLLPANSFTVVSPTEIQASSPIGLGSVNVQVVDDMAVSASSAATRFTYTGGPPGSENIVEPYGGGDPDLTAYAGQVSGYCATHDCGAAGVIGVSQAAAQASAPITSSSSASGPSEPPKPDGITGLDWFGFGTATAGVGLAILCGTTGGTACVAIGAVLAVVGFGQAVWQLLHDGGICFKILSWDVFSACPNAKIDPSGTVVDTGGNPVSGATVTILGQPSGSGPFTAVDPASGAIDPATNPETTSASGAFHWDAVAGAYQVAASATGCHAPGAPAQSTVTTPTFLIPPPKTGIVLSLDCGAASSPVPTVTGVAANSGPTAGGDAVDISGTNFVGATSVSFGSVHAAAVQVLSAYAIRVIAPAGTGNVHVTVTTPGGTSATSTSDSYQYVQPQSGPLVPSISSVSPNAGPLAGGTQIVISGDNLGNASGVAFAGTPATSFTPVSATEIDAIAPAATISGQVDISVTTPHGRSAPTSADRFFYGAPGALAQPAVSGAVLEGQQLSASDVTWTGSPASVHTQWERCSAAGASCAVITGATGNTYVLGKSDVGHRLRVTDSATNAVGTGTVTSALTAEVWTIGISSPAALFASTRAMVTTYGATAGGAPSTYDVLYRTAAWNGGFGPYLAPTAWQHTPQTHEALTGAFGHEYCFAARVRDSVGDVTPWSADRCSVVPLDDRSLAAGVGWTRTSIRGAFAGTISYASRLGAQLTVSKAQFDQLAIVAATCPTCGKLGVYVNGHLLASINTASSFTRYQHVFTLPRIKLGVATVVLRVLTSGKKVYVDGLSMART